MSNTILYIALIGYWIFFYKGIIFNPYSIASGEALDCDFPTFKLCGEYWRRFKLPKDPYYFRDLTGVRTGTYYPINIILSWLTLFTKSLDTAWCVYVFNILLHNFLTLIFSYHLFGTGLIGLFGALAWTFAAYHVKTTLWYVQTFTWITATLLFAQQQQTILMGASLGMLYLAGHPPLVLYFMYAFAGYCILHWYFPIQSFIIGILIGLPQLYALFRYRKYSRLSTYDYHDKRKIGSLPLWLYFSMLIPIKYREFVAGVEYREWNVYVTPVIFFLALFSRSNCWILLLISIALSFGKGLFKLFNKLMCRFPHRWAYFATMAMVVLGVDGLRNWGLTEIQLICCIVLLGIYLIPNISHIKHYPFSQWIRRPSKVFNTPVLKYLEKHANKSLINNLPYPVYTGQINHLNTLGYTGGNHILLLGYLLNIPLQGYAPFDYFKFNKDGNLVDTLHIKYHVGYRPSKNEKWMKIRGLNLWENTNVK